MLIGREDELVLPNGGTVIEAGDTLLVMADREMLAEVCAIVGSPDQTEPETTQPSALEVSDRQFNTKLPH